MTSSVLNAFSTDMAEAVARAAPAVVQVQGDRRPVTGVVFTAADVVLTMARAIGREDGLRVRTDDARTLDAELAGWDPTTGLAVLRIEGLGLSPLTPASEPARVGQLAIAVARSWSNALTASAGIVSVIGGPLPTGRRRQIDQVIRTDARMHDGFAGGALLDSSGRALGLATALSIRGLGVVIPATIAWRVGSTLLEHGRLRRGYLGIAAQPVQLGEQRLEGRERGLLVVGVTSGSPAEAAGLLVGDVITDCEGHRVESNEDLLELLVGERVGRQVLVHVLRGTASIQVSVTIAERPAE